MIEKLKKYYVDLIKNDTSLGQEIENYIRKRQQAEEQKRDREEAKALGLEEVQLSDEDYINYYENLEEQRKLDIESLEEDK